VAADNPQPLNRLKGSPRRPFFYGGWSGKPLRSTRKIASFTPAVRTGPAGCRDGPIHETLVDEAAALFVVHDLNLSALESRIGGFVQSRNWFQDYTSVTIRSS
jgi:hypothetical protein